MFVYVCMHVSTNAYKQLGGYTGTYARTHVPTYSLVCSVRPIQQDCPSSEWVAKKNRLSVLESEQALWKQS